MRGRMVHVAAKIDQSLRVMVTDQVEMGSHCSQFGLGEVWQPNWHGTFVTLRTYLVPSEAIFLVFGPRKSKMVTPMLVTFFVGDDDILVNL